MTNIKQVVILVAASVALIAALSWWFNYSSQNTPELLINEESGEVEELDGPLTIDEREVNENVISNDMNPTAVFTTNYGVFEIELYADLMPITAGNFVTLAEDGYYDGTKFHRVIDGFMIQGGDPNSKESDDSMWGRGGPGYAIEDEHIADEKLSNVRGTISMANSGPNSGGSQFFINTVDNLALDFDKQPLSSKHPVFGRVTSGIDIIDTISGVETASRDIPVEPVVVESVKIVRG